LKFQTFKPAQSQSTNSILQDNAIRTNQAQHKRRNQGLAYLLTSNSSRLPSRASVLIAVTLLSYSLPELTVTMTDMYDEPKKYEGNLSPYPHNEITEVRVHTQSRQMLSLFPCAKITRLDYYFTF
jgi:hypothetical protein